jgi:hypothetical protein
MSEFVDKKKRVIRIEANDNAYAYHDGKQIGFVTTTGQIEIDNRQPLLPPQITGWEVDKAYRRAGICEEMVRQLFEIWGVMAPAEKNMGIGDVNALTDDGMAITMRCQELGYIGPFEDEQPPRGYEDD